MLRSWAGWRPRAGVAYHRPRVGGRRRRRGIGDRGTASVELALVAPVLVAFMLLVVFAGRIADADATVQRAASEAARAASLRQHPADGIRAAEATVDANLAEAGVDCQSLTTSVDTGDFRPGGSVAVTVTCVASMRDVTFIGVPGTREFRSRAVEPIDRYRAGSDEFGLPEGPSGSDSGVEGRL